MKLALIVLLLMAMGQSCQSKHEVHLGIWSGYVTPEILAQFEQETGIKVMVSNYSSNEELLAKLQAGGSGFDVVVPSDYMVATMIKLGLLQKLQKDRLSHAKDLGQRFLGKNYDPKNDYSLPYDWGTTGIAVNHKIYKGPAVRSWSDFYKRPDLAGKIALLDDTREVIGSVLKMQGHSLNSREPKELEQAKAFLLQAKKRVKLFSSEALMTLTNGEAAVTHAYSCDGLQARSKLNNSVDYVLPAEGGTFWIDNLVIPAGAKEVDAAHRLVDFLLGPKVVAATVVTMFTSPANSAAMGILPAELLKNRSMFPDENDLKKFEMIEDLGDAIQIWDQMWTEIKAI